MGEKPFEQFRHDLPPHYAASDLFRQIENSLEQHRLATRGILDQIGKLDLTLCLPSSGILDQIKKSNAISQLSNIRILDQVEKSNVVSRLSNSRILDQIEKSNVVSRLSLDSTFGQALNLPKICAIDNIWKNSEILACISEQSKIWQNLHSPSNALTAQLREIKIAQASMVWGDTIKQLDLRFQDVHLSNARADFASRLLEPSKAYTKFVERTYKRIEKSESKKVSKALELSLELAEQQLQSTTDNLTEFVTSPEESEVVSPVRHLLLPVAQQNELISIVQMHEEYDEETLIDHSIIAKNADDAKLILQLVNRCNELALSMGRTEIFKPTIRLMEVYADLPWLMVRSKSELADFVDCLYFMFYEGAGKDKLRFLEPHGGVLDTNGCNFIWSIKSLRNKWLRHDINHGKESDIRKSWSTLAETLKEMGFKRIPTTNKQFTRLHQHLLADALVFLNVLHENLSHDRV